MPSRTPAIHHQHKRKRTKDVHPIIDKLVYLAAIISPAMTIPQVLKIWVEQNASGISVITWVTYLLVSVIWMIYGIAHKERSIIFSNLLWLIMNPAIIIGSLLYG